MSNDQIFQLSNVTVLPFWILMIALPRWRWTQRLIALPAVAILPALLYAALVIPQLGGVLSTLSNPSLAGLLPLLATPAGLLVAWAHFLAFDLMLGRWMYLDSQQRGVPALVMVLPLFFTFMLGPIGYLIYLAITVFTPNKRTT